MTINIEKIKELKANAHAWNIYSILNKMTNIAIDQAEEIEKLYAQNERNAEQDIAIDQELDEKDAEIKRLNDIIDEMVGET